MPEDSNDSIDSTLYREFLAEREEVLRHKWIQSEEAGHDVGLESALVDWAVNHRETWKKQYRKGGQS